MEQPPIGIMPMYIWLEKRQRELLETIDRYRETGSAHKHQIKAWLAEYYVLVNLNDEAHKLFKMSFKEEA